MFRFINWKIVLICLAIILLITFVAVFFLGLTGMATTLFVELPITLCMYINIGFYYGVRQEKKFLPSFRLFFIYKSY